MKKFQGVLNPEFAGDLVFAGGHKINASSILGFAECEPDSFFGAALSLPLSMNISDACGCPEFMVS